MHRMRASSNHSTQHDKSRDEMTEVTYVALVQAMGWQWVAHASPHPIPPDKQPTYIA